MAASSDGFLAGRSEKIYNPGNGSFYENDRDDRRNFSPPRFGKWPAVDRDNFRSNDDATVTAPIASSATDSEWAGTGSCSGRTDSQLERLQSAARRTDPHLAHGGFARVRNLWRPHVQFCLGDREGRREALSIRRRGAAEGRQNSPEILSQRHSEDHAGRRASCVLKRALRAERPCSRAADLPLRVRQFIRSASR